MSATDHNAPPVPRFLNAGDGGLVVELGNEISEAVNARVIALDAALTARAIPGIRETVPTYRSLLVQFDPLVVSRDGLRAEILALWPQAGSAAGTAAHWLVPVVYGGAWGADLDAVAEAHELTVAEVVRLHAAAEYRVYMIGFAPGFAYLGGLPERLHTSRRQEPRMRTPPRSISIGGVQAAISPPIEVPSGWHLLGQTPVRSYDPRRVDRPFLFAAGDHVRFEPISARDYERLSAAAEAGDEVAVRERGGG